MGTAGSTRRRNGSCISSECSGACALTSSWTTEAAARMASATSASIGIGPRGVLNPPLGYNATPSKATRCDGPTSTATSKFTPCTLR